MTRDESMPAASRCDILFCCIDCEEKEEQSYGALVCVSPGMGSLLLSVFRTQGTLLGECRLAARNHQPIESFRAAKLRESKDFGIHFHSLLTFYSRHGPSPRTHWQ